MARFIRLRQTEQKSTLTHNDWIRLMDRIGSNPYLNTTRLYQQSLQQRQETQQSQTNSSKVEATKSSQSGNASGFSGMFGDNELLKLQGNLEAIAQMAEHALKRFDG